MRTAGPSDLGAIRELYVGLARNGLLTREGPEFPGGVAAVLERDVVAVAETSRGEPVGYLAYARGSGYRGSELRVFECIARGPAGTAALLGSLASWSSVVATVRWRGPTEELGLQLPRALPTPFAREPWMLRIVDSPAAIALRGWPAEADVDVSFVLHDPDVPEHNGSWRLRVASGSATLERATGTPQLPSLSVRGLALLYAGAADTPALRRAGLLDAPAPGLDAAFAGHPPVILDYF